MRHFSVGVLTDGQIHLWLRRTRLIDGHHGDPVTRDFTRGSGPSQNDFFVRHLKELQVGRGIHFICGYDTNKCQYVFFKTEVRLKTLG